MIMNKICAIFSDQKINKSVHHTTILWPFSQMWITLHFVNRCVRVCVHVLRALICIYPNSIKCDMDKLIFIVPVTVTIKLFSILFSPTYSLCSNPLLPWLSSYGFMVELIKWYSRLYCILKNLHKTTVFHHIFSTNKSLSVHHQMIFFLRWSTPSWVSPRCAVYGGFSKICHHSSEQASSAVLFRHFPCNLNNSVAIDLMPEK